MTPPHRRVPARLQLYADNGPGQRRTPKPLLRALITMALLVAPAACARAVTVGTGPDPLYAVEVLNNHAEDMIVSYDDGTGAAAVLGTVQPGRTERFLISAPARMLVTITARNVAGSVRSGPYEVTLRASESVSVVLRPGTGAGMGVLRPASP